ncbi:MAG: FtsQ-type POTRA domain-containing protein, partial [Chloroflexi bacterium]|nr:FtsQ-type POTRA domain-containing protein [Chloroflexota bacterium]
RGRVLYFALLFALLWALNHLLTSPDFQVNIARVHGNQLVPAEEIVEAASLPRESILATDPEKIRDSVLQLKQIKAADIRTRFPNEVQIYVTERTPSYIWKVGNTLYLASDDGILLGTSETAGPLVALVDVDARQVAVGDVVDVDALLAASKLSLLLPQKAGITPRYFEYSSKEGVVLPTDFAGRVIFGRGEDLDEKVESFRAISDKIRRDNLKVQLIDLRFKDKPTPT